MNRRLTPEGAIQRQVMHYLKVKGWFVFKNHQSLGSHKGVADLVAMRRGSTIWIEVKTPTGRLSKYQQKFKEDVEMHGGTFLVVRSLDDMIEYLDGR